MIDGEIYEFHSLVGELPELLYTDSEGKLILVNWEDVKFFCHVCHLWRPIDEIENKAFVRVPFLMCKQSYQNLIEVDNETP